MIDRPLDQEVATRIMGYRWVEWNHALLQGAPLDQPGRFLTHVDDPLAHLQMPAAPNTPEARNALNRLPPYSSQLDLAMEAARRVGLFAEGGAELTRTVDGAWQLEVRAADLHFVGPDPAPIVCRAALEWQARLHTGT